MEKGAFQQDWKNARVTPVDKNDINDEINYRPIFVVGHTAKKSY